MVQTLLKVGATLIGICVAYTVGLFIGYRSAVTDYVENDAKTIKRMADSMYQNVADEKSRIADTSDSDPRDKNDNRDKGFR